MKRILLILLLLACTLPPPADAFGPAIQAVLGASGAACGASIFEDNFNRADNASIGGSWASETDTGGLLSISNNTFLHTHSDKTNAIVAYTHTGSVTEWWAQVTVTFNEVTGWGAGKAITWLEFRTATAANGYFSFNADASGNASRVYVSYRNDSNSPTSANYTFSPEAGVAYTIKMHFKQGADNTGEVHVWINGTERITLTNLAFNTYAVSDRIRFGNEGSGITSTTLTITYDNFEWRTDDCFD